MTLPRATGFRTNTPSVPAARLTFSNVIEEPPVIEKVLRHLGLRPVADPLTPLSCLAVVNACDEFERRTDGHQLHGGTREAQRAQERGST